MPFGQQPPQPHTQPPVSHVIRASGSFDSMDTDVSELTEDGADGADDGGPARNTRAQQRLREQLQMARRRPAFERLRVTGDGACMFRSVAQGDSLARTGRLLEAQEEWEAARKLRADVVERLRESRSDIEPFIPGIVEGRESFDAYLARMARPSTWGGEPELAMAVQVLQRPIAVYSPAPQGPQHIITYGTELKKETPMHVLWSGNHYDLLIPSGTPRSKL